MNGPGRHQSVLDEILDEVRACVGRGRRADYIPRLARVPADRFGIALQTVHGDRCHAGDAEQRFSIQSISKVFTLSMALQLEGNSLWSRVGREPSGDPFNSLVQLEHENGVPRNPFINAGALVVADAVITASADAKVAIRDFVRDLSGDPTLDYDIEVARSEREWGDRNAALAHFLKSFGVLRNDVDEVLDVYVHQCALSMSCTELARAFGYLANGGRDPHSGREIMAGRLAKRVNALMLTCGVYDAAGDFAYRVGLPGKSGVGGGIVAVMPGAWSVAVWSPGLNDSGNSLAGTRALELLTTKTGLSIF